MNCPNCGAAAKVDQQFCRSCGNALSADERRPGRRRVAFMLAFMLMFLGVMVALSGDMAGLNWLKFTGVFIAITGIFSTAAASMLIDMGGSGGQMRNKAAPPPTLERSAPTNKLLPVGENDFIPSVVENTTELLVRAERDTKN